VDHFPITGKKGLKCSLSKAGLDFKQFIAKGKRDEK
jgi:hypothetical protein